MSRACRPGRNASALFGGEEGHQNVAFHAGHGFDLTVFPNFAEEPGHLGATHFLVSHFAATMKNHGADFMAFPEEADDLILTNLIIVLGGSGAKLYFFQLRTAAALALLVRLFIQLILVFAVVGDFANRRIRGRRYLHQIQSPFARQTKRFKRLHNTQLPAIFINHSNFPSAYPFVNADTVGLPEIPLSDKSP